MFRKALIIVLTLSALAMGAVVVAFTVHPYPELKHMVSGGPDSNREPVAYCEWGRAGAYLMFRWDSGIHETRLKPSVRSIPGLYWLRDPYEYGVAVSIWTPLALTFILASYPAVAFVRGPVRRWRRRRHGLCLDCGYNLTGNVSGICPECGSGIVAA